jgi:hypothetical protein
MIGPADRQLHSLERPDPNRANPTDAMSITLNAAQLV